MPRGFGRGNWHGRFRGCGYRWTIARQSVLDVLGKATRHLSAEDIYMQMHKVNPGVGLTTIYRTLELLVQMGIVIKSDFGEGRARYEMAEGPKGLNHHHHLICTGCGKVIDYTDFIDDEVELLQRTEKGLSKKYNFKISNHLIQFYGLCQVCKNK
ncbi:MAG: transcriptional repressor [Candidatus Omnitrophica bacterium]|nr:transcriptional repressor [Candidatus Omnitrophota bacterium]